MIVNEHNCDFRAYDLPAFFARNCAMDRIDGQWIQDRLTGERGERTRLANHLGISLDKLSKTLKGERRIQENEFPLLLKWFNVRLENDKAAPDQDLQEILREARELNEEGRQVLREHLRLILGAPEYRR
ncbi:hypothetical protein [Mangrovicoccus ximenensis]|uniref:hypothetical protein n=1 Tax=Mangrovicoccus ximenensis TaxID=1911570 RepID=UPI0011AE64B3|nr:hypothetical protein [Mangrovicoccus ximenensis]